MKLPLNLYDAVYAAAFVPAAAAVALKMRRHGKYRESAPALLGKQVREDAANPLFKDGCVWVHAVSVGEVIAARAMLPLLRERFAPLPILLTTHTETGQATARNLPAGMVDAVRYLPLDFSWLMSRAVRTWRPKIFIPMETELWPNALQIISDAGAKIFTLNGKISERSFRSYSRIGPLIRQPLSRVTAFCVQTQPDANRVAALLGRNDNIHVTGNCKFDVEIPPLDDAGKQALAQRLGLPWPARYIVAGSTHPGEEEIILDALRTVEAAHPEVALVLVPRHPERFTDVWEMLKEAGLGARRTSDGATAGPQPARVHLVDQMGVLTQLYGLAEVAVVAGSFVPGIGGHNLLEPAAHRVPVVYGPYMKSQPDMVRIMAEWNAAVQVTGEELAGTLQMLLDLPSVASEKGEAARTAYLANRGAAGRNMEVLERYLAGGLD